MKAGFKSDIVVLLPELRWEAYLWCGNVKRADVLVAKALQAAISQAARAPEDGMREWLVELIERAAVEHQQRRRRRGLAERKRPCTPNVQHSNC
jgi:DNA-directed RNA polymerase specialized sigma24 family protein